MPRLVVKTFIAAPQARCFDVARDIDLHTRTLAHTGERAVGGVTSGLIGMGESVTWEGVHFGVRQRLTSRITAMDPPRYFRDEMTRGAFAVFIHHHRFEAMEGGTRMVDEIVFRSPFGPIGALVDRVVMTAYLRRLISGRGAALKAEAEGC